MLRAKNIPQQERQAASIVRQWRDGAAWVIVVQYQSWRCNSAIYSRQDFWSVNWTVWRDC